MKFYYLKEKLYIGISGHRDLEISKIKEYKKEIKILLQKISDEYPDKEVIIISPLADGADRLAVYAARELGLRYDVLLPMPLEYYEMDFDDISYREFMELFYGARSSESVPLCDGASYKDIAEYSPYRDRQYLRAGEEIIDRSDAMIFLWDGVVNEKIGGTSDIYRYAKIKNKRTIVVECERDSREEGR